MADITVYSAPDGAGQVAVPIEEIEQLLGRHLHPRERNLIKPFLNRNGFLIGDRAAVAIRRGEVPFEDVQLWTTRLLVEIEGTGTQLPPKPDFDAANRLLAELREAAL